MSESDYNDDTRQARTYKLKMVNIFMQARHRTYYLKPLEKITDEPRISFEQIAYGIGMGVGVIVFFMFFITHLNDRFKYMGPWLIMLMIMSLLLVLLYMLPVRHKSVLGSVLSLFKFQILERSRLATAKNGRLPRTGITSCSKDGLLKFDSGQVGRAYKVEGQMSKSVLPAVADMSADLSHDYSIQRTESVQEKLITSIRPADVSPNKKYLKALYEESKDSGDESRDWDMHYAAMIHGVIADNMEREDTQLFQTLLICDEDEVSLEKSLRTFEDFCERGLYSRAEALNTRAEVARAFAGLPMLSIDGLSKITGRDERNAKVTIAKYRAGEDADDRSVIDNEVTA